MPAAVESILFAFEIAKISEEIAPWVDLMGRRFGAEMHVLHVIPKLDYYGVPYAIDPRRFDDMKAIEENAEEKVAEFCSEHLREIVKPKITVLYGNPVDEIIKYVEAEKISLVIMGTHGRGGLDRAVFGSVTDRVLRLSPVPVLCINPHPKR